jgi:DNA-binding HxlR family transcriptional regulator
VRDALFAGATRFSDFHKGLGIATNILTSRLDGLVGAGIMERRGYSENPELHEYLLTDKGRELAPVIVALTEWGDRWAAPDGRPVLYTHAPCGGEISQHISCATCGQVQDLSELRVRPGPGMPADRAAHMTRALGTP